jgi:hypothetical protein
VKEHVSTEAAMHLVIAAIRAGVAYANVHATPLDPGGEIRGQIRDSNRKVDDNDGEDHDR